VAVASILKKLGFSVNISTGDPPEYSFPAFIRYYVEEVFDVRPDV
jgi:hypothetical protein